MLPLGMMLHLKRVKCFRVTVAATPNFFILFFTICHEIVSALTSFEFHIFIIFISFFISLIFVLKLKILRAAINSLQIKFFYFFDIFSALVFTWDPLARLHNLIYCHLFYMRFALILIIYCWYLIFSITHFVAAIAS